MCTLRFFIFSLIVIFVAYTAPISTAQNSTIDLEATTVDDGLNAYVSGDYSRAFEIWSYHAKRFSYDNASNSALAQTNLGALYYMGKGTYQSYLMAAYWHQEAANNRLPLGQNNLGEAYENGHGIFKDPYKALELYRRAASQNELNAVKNLKRLETKMKDKTRPVAKTIWNPKTLEEAVKLAKEYADTHKLVVAVFNVDDKNFDETISKAFVYFLDLVSVEKVNIDGVTYTKARFQTQYFRDQLFAAYPGEVANRYKSEQSIVLIDCGNKTSDGWSRRIFELDELTGKIDNYESSGSDYINLRSHEVGTLGYAKVQAVCESKYIYSPQ